MLRVEISFRVNDIKNNSIYYKEAWGLRSATKADYLKGKNYRPYLLSAIAWYTKGMARQLSKSDFLLFLKHPAWLWLKKFEPSKLPPIDASTQALFDMGFRFEAQAEKLFSGGERITGDYFEKDTNTARALATGAQTLFQAKFTAPDNTACLTDVMVRVGGDEFDVYEIKVSTKAKPEHTWDLAFQKRVIEACGYRVRKTAVVHVNNTYVRQGDIDIMALTGITDVTDEVANTMPALDAKIKSAFEVITGRDMPDPSLRYAAGGGVYDWLPIYKSLKGAIPEDSIYNLARLNPQLANQLEDADIMRMQDIPPEILSTLVPSQQMQIATIKTKEPRIDADAIATFMATMQYPLYFLDYETAADAVPLYDGTKPYQQVTMQYSLHILDAPGAELRHTEFLWRDQTNPMPALIDQLKKDIDSVGSVVVWYKNFECGRHSEMAEMYPEHAEFLLDLNRRVVDLIDPFKQQLYVDYRFGGSASIKNVLPVLAPDLSYKELGIQNGGAAQGSYMKAVFGDMPAEEAKQVFADLLVYCALDTLAMVRIYEVLAKIVAVTPNTQPSLFS